MPIQTTGCRPSALPRSEPFWPASLSSSMAFLMSRRWRSVSSSGAMDCEDLEGFLVLALEHQEPRRFGQGEGDPAVDDGGDGAGDEHPAPGLDAEPQVLVGAAGEVGEHGVGEQRGEDTGGDGELLQRGQPAAHVARRDLRDVGRGDHRGEADAQAADEAPEDQVPHAEGEAGAEGADQEQQGAELHGGDAAVTVRDLAGQVGAGRAAEQGDGDGEAGHGLAEGEFVLDGVDCAVDNRGVEAEEEAANGARHGQPNDPLGDLGDGLVLGGGHMAPSAIRGPRLTPQLPSLTPAPPRCACHGTAKVRASLQQVRARRRRKPAGRRQRQAVQDCLP